jgi:hypothetical protein
MAVVYCKIRRNKRASDNMYIPSPMRAKIPSSTLFFAFIESERTSKPVFPSILVKWYLTHRPQP